jgi:uncharacterized protein YjbI with pentapeptide repeats
MDPPASFKCHPPLETAATDTFYFWAVTNPVGLDGCRLSGADLRGADLRRTPTSVARIYLTL